jgi:hypothetical protein
MHELLISLTITSVVFALASHFALRQTRFFRALDEEVATRSQLDDVTGILRNALSNVSPSVGELVVAQDSALEIRLMTATSFVCSSAPGTFLMPAASGNPRGPPSAFVRPPAPGDRVSALFSDSVGVTWLHLGVAATTPARDACSFAPDIAGAWSVATVEPLALPPGTPLRLTRPVRLSLYRAPDGRWHLGARDWNGVAQQFNTIQPVAGPLAPYDDAGGAGLRFDYGDRSGAELRQPFDVSTVASVTVTARLGSDSSIAVVRLRDAP